MSLIYQFKYTGPFFITVEMLTSDVKKAVKINTVNNNDFK